jgi:hypothetical protein
MFNIVFTISIDAACGDDVSTNLPQATKTRFDPLLMA